MNGSAPSKESDSSGKSETQDAYTRMVGSIFENLTIRVSDENPTEFLLPKVAPTSNLERSSKFVTEVREKLWKCPNTPPALNCPKWVYLVDGLNDTFDSALKDLEHSPAVGVKLEGLNISRSGDLYSIAMTTISAVYIFDMTKLQRDVFKYGLGYILESPKIVKVFHDVRFASDMLRHQYGIMLSNVFDTSLADITFFTTVHTEGFMPKLLRSYQGLCMEYLGVPSDSLFYHIRRLNRQEEDELTFWKFPFTRQILLALSRNCMYLLPLHDILQRALLYHINKATDIFLGVVRDRPSYEAKLATERCDKHPNRVPKVLREMFPTWSRSKEKMEEKGETVEEEDFVFQDVGDNVPRKIYSL